MYDIEEADFGIRVTLEGRIDEDELKGFYEELEQAVERQLGSFNIYADHRGVKTMPEGIDEKFANLMEMCKNGGLEKSVVILDSHIPAMQQRRLRDEAGLDNQKVINTEENPDWQQEARNWVTD